MKVPSLSKLSMPTRKVPSSDDFFFFFLFTFQSLLLPVLSPICNGGILARFSVEVRERVSGNTSGRNKLNRYYARPLF